MRDRLEQFWREIKPHPMLPQWRRWLQWGLIGTGGGTAAGIVLFLLMFILFSFGLPDIKKGEDLLQAQSTLILDREGNILYAVHGEENRKIVGLKDISPSLIDATIAVEDRKFFRHHGFDVPCYAKAIAHEIFGIGIRRGCSTITQQLVKNLFLTPKQTYKRKFQELILALKVERRFSKEEILELYLNEIPYGNNAYGAELAAQTYFDKPAKDLTLTESAIMAALPKAPTRYSPYGNNRNSHLLVEFTPEQLQKRDLETADDLDVEEYVRGLLGGTIDLGLEKSLYISGRVDIVLNAMLETGMITSKQKEEAVAASHLIEFKAYRENIKYPHFVLYVKELIEEKYGKDLLEQGGLRIYTTIDPKMQAIAEESVTKYAERNATSFKASNASLVAIHPQTGQMLAMIGSADYFNDEIDGKVNVALRPRQPGSSFKPFIYALAFLKGYAPSTVVYDVQTQFGPGQYPQNYDGNFVGPITIRKALAQSRNIPAIKGYFLAGKEEEIIPFVKNFGIGLDASVGYGWPLALGSGEVRLIDMVGGYGVFANGGIRKEVSPILKIENRAGEVLEKWEDKQGTQALDPQVAYLITHILSDSSINLGPRLNIPGQIVAAKTGTSNKKNANNKNVPSNNWALGYSTKLVAGVWVGNADGSELAYNADGYTTAAPIWNEFMTRSLSDMTAEPFPRPEGIIEMAVSKTSGLLPSEKTPDDQIGTDLFASFNIPTELDNRYVMLNIDKFTGLIANEYSPAWSVEEKAFTLHQSILPQYTVWQEAIDKWAESTEGIEKAPTEIDAIHTAQTLANSPSISITAPSNFSQVTTGRYNVSVEVSAPNGLDRVEFYLNDQLQFTETEMPYAGQVRIPVNSRAGKTYKITAYVYDDIGYRSSSTIEVKVAEE